MNFENKTNNIPSNFMLDFVKQHLRIIGDEQNDYLLTLISANVEKITHKTGYAMINNDYYSTYDIYLRTSTLLRFEKNKVVLDLPIVYPFILLNEIKVNGEVKSIEYDNNYYYISLDFSDLTCDDKIFIEISYNAGVVNDAEIPRDLLMLLGIEVEKVYDCNCNCNENDLMLIYNKYNKKRFL